MPDTDLEEKRRQLRELLAGEWYPLDRLFGIASLAKQVLDADDSIVERDGFEPPKQ